MLRSSFAIRAGACTCALILGLAACGGSGSDSGGASSPGGAVVDGDGAQRVDILAGSAAPLASVGSDGDYYLDATTGRLYGPKAGGAWPTASLLLSGPPGPQGPAGPSGPPGPAGEPGSTALGGGRLYSGAGAPANTLGQDGDFYINTSTRAVTGPKANGTWPANGVSVVGGVGPAGPAGAIGPIGATGPAGNSMLSGPGAPGNAFGANGDFYIQTTTSTLFGPKADGVWPAGVSLVGPAGNDGANGAPGPAGSDGRTILSGAVDPAASVGFNGDFYLNTRSSTLFGPKANGAWPAGVSLLRPVFVYNYSVTGACPSGDCSGYLRLGGGIAEANEGIPSVLLPVTCSSATLNVLVNGFTDNQVIGVVVEQSLSTVPGPGSFNLGQPGAFSGVAACAVPSATSDVRSCTADVPANRLQSGQLMAVSISIPALSADRDNFVTASVVCR